MNKNTLPPSILTNESLRHVGSDILSEPQLLPTVGAHSVAEPVEVQSVSHLTTYLAKLSYFLKFHDIETAEKLAKS